MELGLPISRKNDQNKNQLTIIFYEDPFPSRAAGILGNEHALLGNIILNETRRSDPGNEPSKKGLLDINCLDIVIAAANNLQVIDPCR